MKKEYSLSNFSTLTRYILNLTPELNLYTEGDYFLAFEEGHEIFKTKDETVFINEIEDLINCRFSDLPQQISEYKQLLQVYTNLEQADFTCIDISDLLDYIQDQLNDIEDAAGVNIMDLI